MKLFLNYLGYCILFLVVTFEINAQTTVEFPSKDGLLITADLYEVKSPKEVILLCHQAGYSRGEYLKTALQLNDLGYSCMAIDQRSGKGVNGIENETVKRAKSKGLRTTYLDAKQDIEAAIDYLSERNNERLLMIVGSSYSASLVLLIGKENNKVKAVAAFSPGEYLKGVPVAENVSGYSKPVYLTSSKSESIKLGNLAVGIPKNQLTFYKPSEKGIHGSRALWNTTEGTKGYWDSFKTFLNFVE